MNGYFVSTTPDSFIQIFLKLQIRCFVHGLKMCFVIFFFFQLVNLVIFVSYILAAVSGVLRE